MIGMLFTFSAYFFKNVMKGGSLFEVRVEELSEDFNCVLRIFSPDDVTISGGGIWAAVAADAQDSVAGQSIPKERATIPSNCKLFC